MFYKIIKTRLIVIVNLQNVEWVKNLYFFALKVLVIAMQITIIINSTITLTSKL